MVSGVSGGRRASGSNAGRPATPEAGKPQPGADMQARLSDGQALAFFAHYKGAIKWMINSFAIRAHERADVEQAVAIRILTAFRKRGAVPVDHPSAIGYAVTVARNACINHRKRLRPAVGGAECAGAHAVDAAPLPDEQLERSDAHQRLRMAVMQLPPMSRAVMHLTLQGRTVKEIADHCGITEGAAKLASFRARKLLRTRLNPPVRRAGPR